MRNESAADRIDQRVLQGEIVQGYWRPRQAHRILLVGDVVDFQTASGADVQ